jgi:hypothetical protein
VPATNPAVDTSELVAALNAGSAEVVIERGSRQRAEPVEQEAADRRAHGKAVEEARRGVRCFL